VSRAGDAKPAAVVPARRWSGPARLPGGSAAAGGDFLNVAEGIGGEAFGEGVVA
jgi:hypothetical protein